MRMIGIIVGAWLAATSWATGEIKEGYDGRSWELYTNKALYQVRVSGDGDVRMHYFGDKEGAFAADKRGLGAEVTVRGGRVAGTPMIEAVFKDRVRDIELTFDRAEISERDGCQTLIIHQRDTYYPLAVTEYIRVIPEYDLIEKWVELRNTGKKGEILIENAQSGTFFLPKNAYELTQLSGVWGAEYQPDISRLTPGVKTIQVKDFRSFGSSFFAIRPEGERMESQGDVWFGAIRYSGNWRVDFEKSPTGKLQVTGGINFWDQSVTLDPGESFTTPGMLIGYTGQGLGEASRLMAGFTRERVLYPSHREKTRPVLYNSWYATTFDVNETHQLALAKIAKEIGVEVFVIDDGWFKGRKNDRGGLGDWEVDRRKFPDGLQPMIRKINDMGLDFGLWIEPEMVNPNSDLYRTHPDWVFHYPNRERHQDRNQLMLNLAREDVYQYLYERLSALLRENNIKYIKWDMNKPLTDPGFPSAPADEQREVRIRYVENLYRLITALRTEFPDFWFENCASGGGRVDLGIMALSDFSWASDNTDPVDRIFIQHGFLTAYPASSMISWVTQEDWHRQSLPLDFKFDVSLCGVLGVGYDITKWTAEEREVARQKIARYKEIRSTVHGGDLYRLRSPYEGNRSVLQFVAPSKEEAVVFVYNLAEYPSNAIAETKRTNRIRLEGLLPDATYRIDGINTSFRGSELMEGGVEFPVRGAFKSGIFKITRE